MNLKNNKKHFIRQHKHNMSTLPHTDETKDEKAELLTPEDIDQEIRTKIQQVCCIHAIQPAQKITHSKHKTQYQLIENCIKFRGTIIQIITIRKQIWI